MALGRSSFEVSPRMVCRKPFLRWSQCVLCLVCTIVVVKLAHYDLGYAAGLYSGSQTISAAMGLSTDAINRLGLAADQTEGLLDTMPVAYAVTYIFGTVGSALVIALLGPGLLRINLVAACKDYEEEQGGGKKELGGAGSAWHRWGVRAFRVQRDSRVDGLRAVEADPCFPNRAFLFSASVRDGVLRKQRRTLYCEKVTWWRSQVRVKR